MPIDGAVMLKTPVDGNPAQPPRFEANCFWASGVAAVVEYIEVLARENVPIAFEHCEAQVFRQGLELAAIVGIVSVNRVVVEPRADEIVVAWIVQIGALEARGRNFVNPKRF